jgi:hypothetical protein
MGVSKEQFTPKAAILWNTVPKEARERILKNVYCANCMAQVEMVDPNGQEENGNLVLTGLCSKCGHEVVRIVETSEAPTENN